MKCTRGAFFGLKVATKTPETIILTPEALLADNRSKTSKRAREGWYRARDAGDLKLYWPCADARSVVPYSESFVIRSIATGGDREAYRSVLTDGRVKGVIILNHFRGLADDSLDQDLINSGQAPSGCGGLKAKEVSLSNGSNGNGRGIQRYIETEVRHPDVFVQAYTMAAETAYETDHLVLAAAQNHRTGSIFPFAVFRRESIIATAVPLHHLFPGSYDPRRIYNNGMPFLTDDQLPEVFRTEIRENRRYVKLLRNLYPNLAEDQEVQRPHTVSFGEVIKPIQLRYRNTFSRPGSVFSVTIPRLRLEQQDIALEELISGIDQLQYPFDQAVAHARRRELPFSSVYNLLIETGDLDKSVGLARRIANEEWMQDFLRLPGRQILVAEINHGNALRIERFFG